MFNWIIRTLRLKKKLGPSILIEDKFPKKTIVRRASYVLTITWEGVLERFIYGVGQKGDHLGVIRFVGKDVNVQLGETRYPIDINSANISGQLAMKIVKQTGHKAYMPLIEEMLSEALIYYPPVQ